MPEITYAIRAAVLRDAIARAKEVGAYQAYEWLEHHLIYLETQNNGRPTTGNDDSGSDSP